MTIYRRILSRRYGRWWVILPAFLAVLSGPFVFSSAANADTPVSGAQVNVVTTFPAGEHPAGIAVDNAGLMYISLISGQIVQIEPTGQQQTLFSAPPAALGPVGMGLDKQHHLFVNDASFPASGAVYELARNGRATLIPGTDQIGLPDGLAFDSNGNLYVTDDVAGDSKVWRVTPGGAAQVWSADPLLQGGANSIQIINKTAYISVTDAGTMVKIPIEPDGSAGSASVVASDPSIAPVDDGAFDPATGNVYLTSLVGNEIVQITPAGAVTTIATSANGLFTPTNLDLIHVGGRTVLYAVGSDLQVFGPPPNALGEVLKITLP